jgi:hypothetical protein
MPGCIPCKLHAGDTPTLTIDSIVICQTPRWKSPNFCAQNAPWAGWDAYRDPAHNTNSKERLYDPATYPA